MWEFAPVWSNARMTKAQVRKYIRDIKEAQKLAKQKLKNAEQNWALNNNEELEKIEKQLENL